MTNTAEDQGENFTEAANDNEYTTSYNKADYGLEDLLGENSGVTMVGDFHYNVVPLRETLQYSQKRNNKVLYNGDWVGDYNLLEVGSSLGLKTQMEIVDGFVKDNLSQQDYQVYMTLNEINSVGGYDQYIAMIQQQNNLDATTLNQINEQYRGMINYVQSDLFQKRIEGLESKLVSEKGEEILENQIKYDALYEVMLQDQGFDLAEVLNEYSDVEVLFNQGNHDPDGFIENYVNPHLKNKNQITVLNKEQGFYEANGLNIAATTSSDRRIIGSVRMALSQGYIQARFPHVENGMRADLILNGMKTKEEINSLEGIVKTDDDFNRMTNYGKDLEEKTLHILGTHAPLFGNQGYSASAAYLSQFAKLAGESDTHKGEKKVNPMGTNAINTGMNMIDAYLDENNELQYGFINFSENYDSFGGFKDYNVEQLGNRVEEMYQIMRSQIVMQQQASTSSSSQEDQQAA